MRRATRHSICWGPEDASRSVSGPFAVRPIVAAFCLLTVLALWLSPIAGIVVVARIKDTPIPAPSVAVGADLLHDQGITGSGVTVAVIDTGLAPLGENDWQRQTDGSLLMQGNDSNRSFILYRDFVQPTGNDSSDPNGHGTHVVGTIANARKLKSDKQALMGVAPGANLVVARALGDDGSGSYAQMVAAIDWIIAQRTTYNIRVLNLSVYAPVASPYWADPLAQAVMRAWQAGIVVVVAAGNAGPTPASVTVPGNVPYVISVGAIRSGQFTEDGRDQLATFSARGPTESAFAKPDLLVPAVRVVAPMPDTSVLAHTAAAGRLQEKAQLVLGPAKSKEDVGYYQLSGTSMAAGIVSGLVALMLQVQPDLTNDQVKYRLVSTARLALNSDGTAAYSIWEQGAGLVQAAAAVFGTSTAPANGGMDIATDLDPASNVHYWGLTSFDPLAGTFTLPPLATTPAGYLLWAGAGRAWSGANWQGEPEAWAGAGRAWSGAGRAWSGAGRAWSGDLELWAGAGRAWSGALQSTLASRANVELKQYSIMLPLVVR